MLAFGGRITEEQTWSLGTQRAGLDLAVHLETGTLASVKHLNPKSRFPHL